MGDGRLVGVIVSLGGQTPLKLAAGLPEELVLGTSPASIDLAEDRERWNDLCGRLGIPQPPGGDGDHRGRGRGRGRPDRLPGAGAPVLRARWPGHGDRLRRRAAGRGGRGHVGGRRVARTRGRGDRRPAGAGRPVPGGRGRGGRRRRARRHRRGAHLRGHGARRGGRGPLRRLGLRPAAPDPGRRRSSAELERHVRAIAEALAGPRAVQRPVRRQGRPGLRPGGEPPGQPDRPVRGQGDRGAGGHGGGPGDGRAPPWPSCATEGLLRRAGRPATCR